MKICELDMMIIKSLVINRPVLRECGCSLPRVLTIVVPPGMIEPLIKEFKTPLCKCLSMYASFQAINQALTHAFSSPVLITYGNSSRAAELIRYLHTISNTGNVSGAEIVGTPVLVTESTAPMEEVKNYQFFVHMPNADFHIPISDMVPDTKMLAIIARKIEELAVNCEDPSELVLTAASQFYLPQKSADDIQKLVERAKKLVEIDDDVRSPEGLSELFIDAVFEYTSATDFKNVFSTEFVPREIKSIKEDQIMLYSDDYVYMNEVLFKDVLKYIHQAIPAETMKQSLVREGVLCPNAGESSFSVKLTINTLNGKNRIRVLRFNRNSILNDSEVDIVTICENKKGK